MRHLRTLFAASLAITVLSSCGGGGGSGAPSTPGIQAPTVKIAFSPSSIAAGQSTLMTWSSSNAATCMASGAWSLSQPTSGNIGVSLSAAGSYTYTLSCSSSSGVTATGSATLTVTQGLLAILPGALWNGMVGVPFYQTIQATNGVAPFAWQVSSGPLPHNLSLMPSTTNTAIISGTPDTVQDSVTYTIEVTDAAHNTASATYGIAILPSSGDSLVLTPATGLGFPNQIVGTSSTLTETLTNTETSDIVIDGIAITPGGANAGEFKQTNTCGALLAPGASCEINVTFTPSQIGPRAAALTINDNTVGSPQSLPLGGLGVSAGPNVTVSPIGVDFGTQLVGTRSPTQTFLVTNNGAVSLNIFSVTTSSGPFAVANNCEASPNLNYGSGSWCTIDVAFTPDGSGTERGAISISDDATGSPQTISMSGTGSTTTPLLNGYCYACNGAQSKVAQCPLGQPAKTPRPAACPSGTAGVSVDLDTPCKIPIGQFHEGGYCATE